MGVREPRLGGLVSRDRQSRRLPRDLGRLPARAGGQVSRGGRRLFRGHQMDCGPCGRSGCGCARIAVGGDSCGGNLAAVVAQLAREQGGPPLAFQALVYPITDHSFDTPSYRDYGDGYLLTRDAMVYFWNQYLDDEANGNRPLASPLRATTLAGLPPAIVITAEYDPLRDEAEAYAARCAPMTSRSSSCATTARSMDSSPTR